MAINQYIIQKNKLNMETNNWKEIPGLEGLYAASKEGQIQNIVSGKIIKPHISRDGYPRVNVQSADKKGPVEVHRLVALAWHPNSDTLPSVNHIDGNKQNNSADNLEWCTHRDNLLHAYRIGLIKKTGVPGRPSINRKQVVRLSEIGVEIELFDSISAAAKALKVDNAYVSRICSGEYAGAKGMILRFK